eukprot:6192757-Pleurochrysis_carterae.AAC.1
METSFELTEDLVRHVCDAQPVSRARFCMKVLPETLVGAWYSLHETASALHGGYLIGQPSL